MIGESFGKFKRNNDQLHKQVKESREKAGKDALEKYNNRMYEHFRNFGTFYASNELLKIHSKAKQDVKSWYKSCLSASNDKALKEGLDHLENVKM
jgi:hypothetical protein